MPTPVAATMTTVNTACVVFGLDDGTTETDHYADLTAATRNLRHYTTRGGVTPAAHEMAPHCQHGKEMGACTEGTYAWVAMLPVMLGGVRQARTPVTVCVGHAAA